MAPNALFGCRITHTKKAGTQKRLDACGNPLTSSLSRNNDLLRFCSPIRAEFIRYARQRVLAKDLAPDYARDELTLLKTAVTAVATCLTPAMPPNAIRQTSK